MPSKLVYCHADGTIRTRRLPGHLRSLAWDAEYGHITLVGNDGQIIRIEGEEMRRIECATRQNLRAISLNPLDGTALIVGNTGTILLWDQRKFSRINSSTPKNLRAAAWNANGTMALIAGNQGTLLKYSDGTVESLGDCRANLRLVSWRPMTDEALITPNCFAEEFVPSPNLFTYDAKTDKVISVNQGRVDLIGVDWQPSAKNALVMGYDVVWHNGFIGNFDGKILLPIEFENRRVYPVTVSWDGFGRIAANATATTQPGMGQGSICLWDGKIFKPIYNDAEFFFSAAAWNQKDGVLVALASTTTRTFSC